MQPILSIRNLCSGYGKKQVLFGVDLDVAAGEFLLVTGGNGSGKSSLLRAIYGLLPAWNADAEIIFKPDPNGPGFNTKPPSLNLSKGLAFVPQKNAVFDYLTVEDNLGLGGQSLGSRAIYRARRDQVLDSIEVLRPLLSRMPETLSGGERQIVAMAIVLLHQPKLLLLDEPLAGLDEKNLQLLVDLIRVLWRTHNLTVLIVEHRITELSPLSNRTISLNFGQIVQS